jgi:gliding motility-associated lipoprotein GldD
MQKQNKIFPGTRSLHAALLAAMLLVLVAGCGRESYPTPRPQGWPRIDLPEHTYQLFSNDVCPFTFEYPAIGQVERTKSDSCWMDLYFADFNCRWHITYRYVPGSGKTLEEHNEEYRKLVFKHIRKVSQIKELPVQAPGGTGIFYELYGTVGVPAQLFFTDSTHIVLASFYFDTAVRNDSLEPVINFMKDDMLHLAQSLRWK